MLGNDLVDLKQAARESNWQREGYLNKICTPAEQELILSADHPSTLLWLFWTMKEASYKVVNRLSGIRSYAPHSYVCSGLIFEGHEATASVNFDSYHFFIKAVLTEEMIHSSAVLRKEQLQNMNIHYLSNSPAYMDDFNQNCREYLLSKNLAGLPQITHRRTSKTREASVSHHGRYTAILYSGLPYSGSPQSAG